MKRIIVLLTVLAVSLAAAASASANTTTTVGGCTFTLARPTYAYNGVVNGSKQWDIYANENVYPCPNVSFAIHVHVDRWSGSYWYRYEDLETLYGRGAQVAIDIGQVGAGYYRLGATISAGNTASVGTESSDGAAIG